MSKTEGGLPEKAKAYRAWYDLYSTVSFTLLPIHSLSYVYSLQTLLKSHTVSSLLPIAIEVMTASVACRSDATPPVHEYMNSSAAGHGTYQLIVWLTSYLALWQPAEVDTNVSADSGNKPHWTVEKLLRVGKDIWPSKWLNSLRQA